MSVRAGNLPGLRTQAQSKTMKSDRDRGSLRQMQPPPTTRGTTLNAEFQEALTQN